jgi:hypothetical protein
MVQERKAENVDEHVDRLWEKNGNGLLRGFERGGDVLMKLDEWETREERGVVPKLGEVVQRCMRVDERCRSHYLEGGEDGRL